ncbi:putative signal peptide peptidase SppA [Methyloligella halotolerans]|uniref:Putative signal peptide peptidase SppA n=1 Tax=Methyloligella halotolerans TaxID=1177755 RepID=A0A1E2S0C2_9HYPH|nr:signal peptide peptidase SppA [Methyloligella halotolerans]ODA67788.1 putative signal peptide peptidase SppA [Methyloligella halotolerans]
MAPDSEVLIDRRRTRRRLTFWRFSAITLAVLLLMAMLLSNVKFAGQAGVLPHIARVEINGIITDDRKQTELLERLRKADQVKAVIVAIDSPGGTTTGGETLFRAIRRLAEEKPVVATCGTLAASGGYIAAIATDRIFVLGNTLTGSVGVIFQWVNVSELLDHVGVKVEEVRSGKLKAVPNPFEPASEPALKLTREMVDDAKDWFFGLVKDRRKIDLDDVPGLKEGRVYSGRQAVKYDLADAIGDERDARKWLAKEKGISMKTEVIEWSVDEEDEGLLGGLFGSVASSFGFPMKEMRQVASDLTDSLQLDGLVSLWHVNNR